LASINIITAVSGTIVVIIANNRSVNTTGFCGTSIYSTFTVVITINRSIVASRRTFAEVISTFAFVITIDLGVDTTCFFIAGIDGTEIIIAAGNSSVNTSD
jgi:hypothetical protein